MFMPSKYFLIYFNRGGGTRRKVGGHPGQGHLVHGKFRIEKRHFKYFWPQKWGARPPVLPPPVPPPLVTFSLWLVSFKMLKNSDWAFLRLYHTGRTWAAMFYMYFIQRYMCMRRGGGSWFSYSTLAQDTLDPRFDSSLWLGYQGLGWITVQIIFTSLLCSLSVRWALTCMKVM